MENGGSKLSREQAKYDCALPTRYYESDNRLSWEFEENPPIGPNTDGARNDSYCRDISKDGSHDDDDDGYGKSNKKRRTGADGEDGVADDSDDDDGGMKDGEDGDGSKKRKDGKGDSPKMWYRCKLCGQPKTNHVCPYQQSLVRSIGAMVQPAVNAFNAAEPGMLAPALTEMNNLTISAAAVAAENNSSMFESSPSRPTPDRSSIRGSGSQIEGDAVTSAAQVTPESLRSGASSRGASDELSTPQRSRTGTPGSSASSTRRGGRAETPTTIGPLSSSSSSRKKLSHSRMSGNAAAGDQADLLFVEEMVLKPEQFRTVTPSKAITENPDAFTHPALPLPYAQRKRLSDNLFSLSKEIPQLTDECAAVLR